MTERELKQQIFDRLPDLRNLRPLRWTGGNEVPSSDTIGVIIIALEYLDGWFHMPIEDRQLRWLARGWLKEHHPERRCDDDPDSILCLAILY